MQKIGPATDEVMAQFPGKILIGNSGPPCTPKRGDMPYACVDGVANPAAGGAPLTPSGPLRWLAY